MFITSHHHKKWTQWDEISEISNKWVKIVVVSLKVEKTKPWMVYWLCESLFELIDLKLLGTELTRSVIRKIILVEMLVIVLKIGNSRSY